MARYSTRRSNSRSRGSYGRARSYRSKRVSGRRTGVRRAVSGRAREQRVVIQVVGAQPTANAMPYAVAAAAPRRRQF